ncbi:TonB-dependent receptor [Altererythrobacter sp. BO-6]|uniref:TonB-dependent receptor n=1 Tax=Altererythrobacter sp. BO-6 TaxID=2604537 RepID=UPI0013E20234|nr:TonB-dependent receptor [Altererythrobacter sp. BO-6]QIG53779.1 TonB-dependent receptor [Altererythrobacter sp. BO-6]
MNKKGICGAAISTIALTWGTVAYAQDAEADLSNQREDVGIAEIIVSAQKREENLQKTPAAVTAVGADTLLDRGIGDIRAAQMVVPAVRFQAESNNTQVFVRGVGANLDFQNIEPAVAFNFNGVYMPREATSSAFFDLERLEVLPGPQGTLYGRGALGGTVNVQFRRPRFENEGTAILEVGNYSLIHGTMAQDFAFSDDLAVRLAVDYTNHSGYYTSGAEAADDVAGRISFLYEPTDGFSAYLWAFGAKKNGTTNGPVNHDDRGGAFDLYKGFLTKNPWDDVGAAQFATPIAPFLPFTIGIPTAEDNSYHVYSFGGEIGYDLNEDLTLTYIPGYVKLESDPFNWVSVFLAQNTAFVEMTSHELRLSGDTGPVNWLGGLYYYYQDNYGAFINTYGGPANPNPYNQYTPDIRENIIKGSGIFGQATISASDRLRFTVGGRYSKDKRSANGFNPEYRAADALPGTGPFTPPGTDTSFAFRKSYSYLDWKLGVDFDLTPDVLIYTVAQTSHAPGTYNAISQAGIDAGDPFVNFTNPGTPYDGNVEVEEQKLTAYSAGIKSRMLDDTLQVNVEGFFYNYKNLIQQQFSVALLFNPVFNAQKLEIYGFQADLVWKPSVNDQFNGSVSYTRARNQKFTTPGGQDYSGLQPPYSPDWVLLGSYTHTFDVGRDASLDVNVAGRYESSWFADFVHSPGTKQEAGAKFEASITYDSGKNWQLRNLG